MEKKNRTNNDSYICDLINYYKNTGLTIVGLNDSQGVNTTPSLFKNGLLEYLAFALTTQELRPQVISAFSLTMNKTEHIDYFLKNNLSVEEIKLSQIYSAISALEKVMVDFGLPKFFGQVGNVYRLVYSPKPGDEQIRIASALKDAFEPVLIYSSGANNLMREVGSNPFAIKKAYELRDVRPDYYYTLGKIDDPNTLKCVLDSIQGNFDNILGINGDTDIYALGGYIPKSLQGEGMEAFRDFIVKYNDELRSLCSQYGITFVDTVDVGKEYNHSARNFHVSTAGHNALANHILGIMHQNKFGSDPVDLCRKVDTICEISDDGALGVLRDTIGDYGESCDMAANLSGYSQQRAFAIADEHKRESEIFSKVLSKRKKEI